MTNADHAQGGSMKSCLVKVRLPLSAQDHAHGVQAENIWTERLGPDSYRVDNIPFYAYGISLDDIICAREQDGRLVFEAVLSHSGHSTYRVFINDKAGVESSAFNLRWRALEQLGCSLEVAKKRWIAVDVPPQSDVFAVYRELELGEQAAVWTFEEAHCGHDV